MKTKKIWVWAVIFGLLATGTLYVVILSGFQQQDAVNAAADDEQVEQTVDAEVAEEDVEDSQEAFVNEMLPIEKNKRAMTIGVTDEQGVAGFISPGSYVDVVAVLTAPENKGDQQHDSATIILQNVKVLAIAHAADDEEAVKRYQMVTLEVTPREGLALGFATKYDLYLMLRTEGDDKLQPKHTHMHEDELHEGVFRK